MSTTVKGVGPVSPGPHSGLRQRKPVDNESSNASPDPANEGDNQAKDKEEVNWGKTASGQGRCRNIEVSCHLPLGLV